MSHNRTDNRDSDIRCLTPIPPGSVDLRAWMCAQRKCVDDRRVMHTGLDNERPMTSRKVADSTDSRREDRHSALPLVFVEMKEVP